MDEMKQLNRGIVRVTLLLMVIFAVAGGVIWNDKIISVSGGVLIGALTGVIGFQMITHMTNDIERSGNAQLTGFMGYLLRFVIYAVIFVLSILGGINVFGILVGFTCHKVAIVAYSIRSGKEE